MLDSSSNVVEKHDVRDKTATLQKSAKFQQRHPLYQIPKPAAKLSAHRCHLLAVTSFVTCFSSSALVCTFAPLRRGNNPFFDLPLDLPVPLPPLPFPLGRWLALFLPLPFGFSELLPLPFPEAALALAFDLGLGRDNSWLGQSAMIFCTSCLSSVPVEECKAASVSSADGREALSGEAFPFPLPFMESSVSLWSIDSLKNSRGLLFATCSKNFSFSFCFLSPASMSKTFLQPHHPRPSCK